MLVRIDDVGDAPFDIDNNRIVYAHAPSGRVIGVDVTSDLREELWTIPARSHVRAVHVFDRSVLLVVEDDEGVHALWSNGASAGEPSTFPVICGLPRWFVVGSSRSIARSRDVWSRPR